MEIAADEAAREGAGSDGNMSTRKGKLLTVDRQAEGSALSGYVAEAVARQIRHQLLGEELRRYEEENGTFTDEEMAAAQARIFGPTGHEGSANAA
jgi:hypothetical protein